MFLGTEEYSISDLQYEEDSQDEDWVNDSPTNVKYKKGIIDLKM